MGLERGPLPADLSGPLRGPIMPSRLSPSHEDLRPSRHGVTQVKAAGLVQVFDLLAFGDIDAPQPPLIQEGELLPRLGGGGTKCRRRGSGQGR